MDSSPEDCRQDLLILLKLNREDEITITDRNFSF